MSLYRKTVRMAYENPGELREALLPILKRTAQISDPGQKIYISVLSDMVGRAAGILRGRTSENAITFLLSFPQSMAQKGFIPTPKQASWLLSLFKSAGIRGSDPQEKEVMAALETRANQRALDSRRALQWLRSAESEASEGSFEKQILSSAISMPSKDDPSDTIFFKNDTILKWLPKKSFRNRAAILRAVRSVLGLKPAAAMQFAGFLGI